MPLGYPSVRHDYQIRMRLGKHMSNESYCH